MSVHLRRPDRRGGHDLPDWVPEGALHYLEHTERGASIRALARAAGCHASTILRQIRKIETRRDDPLVDAALRKLGAAGAFATAPAQVAPMSIATLPSARKEPAAMMLTPVNAVPDAETLTREAPRILRRLCETGAVLAVAAEMEKAVVVRETPTGGTTRTAVVDTALAQAMALKEWIAPVQTGRIIRYQITTAGRAALSAMIGVADQGMPPGLAESQAPFDGEGGDEWHDTPTATDNTPRRQRMRYALAESPLIALARRKDGRGKQFLSDALVHAGERLREDFELAQMESRTTQNWDRFLLGGAGRTAAAPQESGSSASDARKRVAAALTTLGPGLSDVVLRCCCYLEGLEVTEKRLGWSARSGKVVLRIALIRLSKHYEETIGRNGPMIG